MDGGSADQQLFERLEREGISSIWSTLTRLVTLLDDPSATAGDLKAVVQVDPPLTVRVLRAANSPYYGSRRPISELDEAVIWLGFGRLKEIALNQKVCEIFASSNGVGGYDRRTLWLHSVCTALFAKTFYRRERGLRGETAYVAGLLHDLGILLEDQLFPSEFEQVLEARGQSEARFRVQEVKLLGMGHIEIGGNLAELWNLPPLIGVGMRCHHDPSDLEGEAALLAWTLRLADRVVGHPGIDCPRRGMRDPIVQRCLEVLELSDSAFELLLENSQKEFAEMVERGVV